MEMIKLNSSQVDSACWKNDVMIVRFTSGAVYMYEDVPYSVYKTVIEAPSVGRALNEHLKTSPDVYKCTKLTK